jgi:hypothetical protein
MSFLFLTDMNNIWSGLFVVSKIQEEKVLLQDVYSYALHTASLGSLEKVLPPKKKPPILRDYQQQCIEAVLARKRCICFIRMGAGKTLVSIGLYMRMLHARESDAFRLESGELFLVVAQANLVEMVWVKQAREFGCQDTCYAVRAVSDEPPEEASFVVVSIQILASLLKTHLSEETGLLWQRRVKVVSVDEAQNLRGNGVWCEQVEKLCKRSTYSLGLTGTLFCNDPSCTAYICKALGLHERVCEQAFWSSPGSLQKSKRPPYLAIFEPVSAMIPRSSYATFEKTYASRNDVQGHEVIRSLGECLLGDQEFLKCFHHMSKREKQDRFRTERLAPGLKMKAFLEVIDELFEEEMYKIFVTAMYKDVIFLINEFLLRDVASKDAGLQIYLHYGENTQEENKKALKSYLERPCREDSKAILLLSIRSGSEGLDIVNGEKSPMAHVEFEQPHVVSGRSQIQARIQRPGNPYEVKVVKFKGECTQATKSLEKHRLQAWKHQKAGDSGALLRIKQEDANLGGGSSAGSSVPRGDLLRGLEEWAQPVGDSGEHRSSTTGKRTNKRVNIKHPAETTATLLKIEVDRPGGDSCGTCSPSSDLLRELKTSEGSQRITATLKTTKEKKRVKGEQHSSSDKRSKPCTDRQT